jgi:hypothetical protein
MDHLATTSSGIDMTVIPFHTEAAWNGGIASLGADPVLNNRSRTPPRPTIELTSV